MLCFFWTIYKEVEFIDEEVIESAKSLGWSFYYPLCGLP